MIPNYVDEMFPDEPSQQPMRREMTPDRLDEMFEEPYQQPDTPSNVLGCSMIILFLFAFWAAVFGGAFWVAEQISGFNQNQVTELP